MQAPQQTSDWRMIKGLLQNPQWKIPPELYEVLPKLLIQGLQKTKLGSRAWCSVARMLISLNAQNLAANPPTQNHAVAVSHDLQSALARLESLPEDDLTRLAEAGTILERLIPSTN